MIILGIDPGATGAAAYFDNGTLIEVIDIPFVQEGSRKTKKRIDILGIVGLIKRFLVLAGTSNLCVYLEWAQAMPQQGVSSVFNYGRTSGIIEGVLAGLGICAVKKIVPARWKRQLGLLGNGLPKHADLQKARALYPQADLRLAKHHNRADAILIGHYGCLMERVK